MIKFSVLIPNYGYNQYLIECINSLVFQEKNSTFQYEIIVCDQSDYEIYEKIKKQILAVSKDVIIFHKEEKSLYKARCDLINKASGDYIVFVDSDDFVMKDFLATLSYKITILDFPDIFIQNLCLCDEDGKALNRFIDIPDETNNLSYKDYYFYSNILNSVVRKIFKRNLYQNIINENIINGEDWATSLSIVKYAKKIIVDNSFKKYFYRQLSNSMSRNFDINIACQALFFKDQYLPPISNLNQKKLYVEQKLYDYVSYIRKLVQIKSLKYWKFRQISIKLRNNIYKQFKLKGRIDTSLLYKIILNLLKIRLYFFIFVLFKF